MKNNSLTPKSKLKGGTWSDEAKTLGSMLCYDKLLWKQADENSKPSKSEISLIYTPDICKEFLTEEELNMNNTENAIKELIEERIVSGTIDSFKLTEEGLDRRFEFGGTYFL